jgi:hypothetical protein
MLERYSASDENLMQVPPATVGENSTAAAHADVI